MGKEELKKAIELILTDCLETDWNYNGEDEYPVDVFNKDLALKELLELFTLWEKTK